MVRIRRRLAPGTLRAQRVNVRLAGSEVEAIRRAAALTGMTVSGYVAAAAVAAATGTAAPQPQSPHVRHGRELVRVLLRLSAELHKIGVNLNQLARFANTEGHLPAGLQGALGEITAAASAAHAATADVMDRR